MRTHSILILLALLSLVATGCAAPVGGPESTDKADIEYEFAFRTEDPKEYSVKTDHLGLSLLATVLLDRSDSYSCRGANNQLSLLDIYQGLLTVHTRWADDIRDLGLPVCSMGDGLGEGVDILDYLETIGCTTQRAYRTVRDRELTKRIGGATILNLITPDVASVHVDEPAGFPNGRHPTDQVTDLLLATALVDLDQVDLDDPRLKLNPQANDVPFRDEFPYFAEAHTALPGGDDYYQPQPAAEYDTPDYD